ncbi:hypothetical protein [Vibrio sp. AND4]|uniref:hypothetical protein n=1 Tax=Vibrio sp. AND4 TaxID=314289 RepID=UPI00015F311C|nr:hypothetical protein [Vibrio sp. AND4]EDP60601.1 hypothetical protein AND4_06774 [Vibrio sp. AND4]
MDNKTIGKEFDPSKRVFLKYSSLSAITVAASAAFVPSKIFAATNNTSSSESLTLEELENINFFTEYSDALYFYGVDPKKFDKPIDEVQYVANIMLNESIKYYFGISHSGIAAQMGSAISANEKILSLSNEHDTVWDVVRRHEDYLREIMPEYIAQMIQGTYQNKANLSKLRRDERLQLNSWDMHGILKNISSEEESHKYQVLMSDLCNIAVDFSKSSGANKLAQYKSSDASKWAEELHNSVLADAKIEARIDSMHIENKRYEANQHNTLSLVSAMKILNSNSSSKLSAESKKEFEDTLYNTFYLAASLSIKWGKSGDKYSTVSNRRLITETIDKLRKDSNPEIQEFWKNFFRKHNKKDFVATLTSMNSETSVYSTESVRYLTDLYSEFDDNANDSDKLRRRRSIRSASTTVTNEIIKYGTSRLNKKIYRSAGAGTTAPSAVLNILLFLISTAHYTWAIAGGEEEQKGFADKLGIATQMFETLNSITHHAAVKAISKFMTKKIPSQIQSGNVYFRNYANFWLKLSSSKEATSRVTARIANTIFSNTAVAKFITKASVLLSLAGLGFAIYALVETSYAGETADIVFETLNVIVSFVGVIAGFGALAGAAFAAPLGLALVAAAAIIMLAKWIYDATLPVYDFTPIRDFTNSVIEPNGYLFDENGKFLSIVKDNRGFDYLQNTSFQTLALDSEDNGTLELEYTISNPRAIAVSHSSSRYGVVYSFERYINKDNAKACYQDYNLVSTKGFNKKLKWSGSREIASVIAAVESTSTYNDTAALFLCKLKSGSTGAFMTDGLHRSPKYKVEGFEVGDGDIQDIVAINGQTKIGLLIATKKNLYRVDSGYRATKINTSPLTNNESTIQSVELLAAGNNVHLLLRYVQKNSRKSRPAQLFTVSRSGEDRYTIKESVFFQLNTEDSVVSRAAFYNSTLCNDFVVVGPNGYRRMKAVYDKAETTIIGFGNGLNLPSIDNIDQAKLLKNTYFQTAI